MMKLPAPRWWVKRLLASALVGIAVVDAIEFVRELVPNPRIRELTDLVRDARARIFALEARLEADTVVDVAAKVDGVDEGECSMCGAPPARHAELEHEGLLDHEYDAAPKAAA